MIKSASAWQSIPLWSQYWTHETIDIIVVLAHILSIQLLVVRTCRSAHEFGRRRNTQYLLLPMIRVGILLVAPFARE